MNSNLKVSILFGHTSIRERNGIVHNLSIPDFFAGRFKHNYLQKTSNTCISIYISIQPYFPHSIRTMDGLFQNRSLCKFLTLYYMYELQYKQKFILMNIFRITCHQSSKISTIRISVDYNIRYMLAVTVLLF